MDFDPNRSPRDRPMERVIHQTGVVAFRWAGDQPEFCLITSRRSKRWGFPKGRISRVGTMQEAALQEAFDEAGLAGAIIGEPLSQYVFKKRGKHHEVLMYLMHVQSCEDQWKEAHERSRQWVSLETARGLIDRPQLQLMLIAAAERIFRLASNAPPPLFPNLQIDTARVNSQSMRRD